MSIHITHQLVEQVYDLLRATPPFTRWRLPDPDAVEFHAVSIAGGAQAEHYVLADMEKKIEHHVLRVNPKRHHTLHALQMTVAHEMCHMREYQLGNRRRGCHGRVFHKLAAQVCKHHGYDRGQF